MTIRKVSRAELMTLRRAVILSLALLGACAYRGAPPALAPEPALCADPVHVESRAAESEGRFESEWQRLQTHDQECSSARLASQRETTDRPAFHDHATWWMAAGLVMTLMMVGMWIR